MKKFVVSILCFVYAAASSGATINFHYCMGKFAGWDVAIAAPATCNNCGMNKAQKKDCCNDKHTTLQLKKDQLASNFTYTSNSNVVVIKHVYSSQILSSLFNTQYAARLNHIPPLIQPVSAYILNQVFRI